MRRPKYPVCIENYEGNLSQIPYTTDESSLESMLRTSWTQHIHEKNMQNIAEHTVLIFTRVRKYFGNYFFLFWELIFFLWFQLEVETFQVGVGCPCRGGRPKKKKLEGGWGGGRSASPPDALAEHAAWFAFGSYNFWGLRFIKDLVLCSKTCRFLTEFLGPEVCFFCVLCLYIFGGLRLIKVLGS